MNKKIYYLFFIVFVIIWGLWYLTNYNAIMEKHSAAEADENVSPSSVYIEDENEYIPYMININTANVQELTALDGIGEEKAQNIVEYREENGGFDTVEELLEVNGVGEALLEKIKDNIILEE